MAWIERDQGAAVGRPLAQAPRRVPCVRLCVREPMVLTAPDGDPLHLELVNRSLGLHANLHPAHLARTPGVVDTMPATAARDPRSSGSSVTHSTPQRRRGKRQ